MKEVRYIFLTLFLLAFALTLVSQVSGQFDPVKDDISEKLFSLNALIDSTLTYDPTFHFIKLQTIVNKYKLKVDPSGWGRNIKICADVHFRTSDKFKILNFNVLNSRLIQS